MRKNRNKFENREGGIWFTRSRPRRSVEHRRRLEKIRGSGPHNPVSQVRKNEADKPDPMLVTQETNEGAHTAQSGSLTRGPHATGTWSSQRSGVYKWAEAMKFGPNRGCFHFPFFILFSILVSLIFKFPTKFKFMFEL
jgi:hypothetical protein